MVQQKMKESSGDSKNSKEKDEKDEDSEEERSNVYLKKVFQEEKNGEKRNLSIHSHEYVSEKEN